MVLIRFIFILFNVAVVAFLIYRMVTVTREPVPSSKKATIIVGGVLLILAPMGMFFGIFAPTFQYFIIYPVAISLFLFLTKQLEF